MDEISVSGTSVYTRCRLETIRVSHDLQDHVSEAIFVKLTDKSNLTPTTRTYFCTNHGHQRGLFQFEIIINVLVSSFRFM